MKIFSCITFLMSTYIVGKSKAYFGLTEKSQLSDLWNIDLDAASLATANHFKDLEKNIKEPQPSLDYKPVDMSKKEMKPIPVKRKRASRTFHHPMNHRHTDFDQHEKTAPSTTSNHRSPHIPHKTPQRSHQFPKHVRGLRGQSRSPAPTKRATFYNHPQNKDSASGDKSNTKLSNAKLDNFKYADQFRIQNSNHVQMDDEDKKSSLSELDKISRDLDILINRSHTVPRIRNERESGKRRDLIGISRKPQQYLIASSILHSESPSKVRLRNEYEPNIEKRKNNQHNGSSSRNNSERFFHFNENVLNSHSSFTAAKSANATSLVEPQKISKKDARKLCDSFKLTSYQRKKCKKDPGLPQVLARATHIAAAECMFQFRYERWNCSLGTSRIHLLNRGNKETAFLYSISSAGLTHSVARACAEGHLESCSCEESFADHVNQEAWLWGGCGDNVHFAAKFVKKFLRSYGDNIDIRAEIDRHNSDLGIRFVRSNVRQTCKCHGVSGSCTTKSCWRKMAPFFEIGRKIKRAYDKAVKVENTSNSSGKPNLVRVKTRRRRQKSGTRSQRKEQEKRKNNRQSNVSRNSHRTRATSVHSKKIRSQRNQEGAPRKKELVYLESSPQYCKKSKYSLGTKGRICGKESNCERMCCGRGYTTHVRIIRRSCQCQVKWCCYVQCKTCNERKQIRTCK